LTERVKIFFAGIWFCTVDDAQSELTDWNGLFEIAGRLGRSEREFRHTTPRYFYFRHKGFESVRLEDARSTRVLAFYSFLPHTKKGSLKRPEDLYRLPGDRTSLETVEAMIKKERSHMADVLRIAKNVDFFKGETMPQA